MDLNKNINRSKFCILPVITKILFINPDHYIYISFYEPSSTCVSYICEKKKKKIDFLNSLTVLHLFRFFSLIIKETCAKKKKISPPLSRWTNVEISKCSIHAYPCILTLCAHVFANDLLPTINARYAYSAAWNRFTNSMAPCIIGLGRIALWRFLAISFAHSASVNCGERIPDIPVSILFSTRSSNCI